MSLSLLPICPSGTLKGCTIASDATYSTPPGSQPEDNKHDENTTLWSNAGVTLLSNCDSSATPQTHCSQKHMHASPDEPTASDANDQPQWPLWANMSAMAKFYNMTVGNIPVLNKPVWKKVFSGKDAYVVSTVSHYQHWLHTTGSGTLATMFRLMEAKWCAMDKDTSTFNEKN
ncbi:hypothetical protein DFH28DRAFT_921361 [Melampsora americana]|nr:hypothetical protein DFH28DRAFT_921361 [Melampsora americana]